MRDNVELHIADRRIDNFLSYRVESDLFTADDIFSFEMHPDIRITEGARCKLYVNDRLELNGIADRIVETCGRDNRKLRVEGRDLMGLLVDSYAEDYTEKKGESLKSLAERLLQKVPYINRKEIIYGRGSKAYAAPITDREEDFEFTEIEPARTIFEILKQYAMSRGMLFFSRPDGTLVFGRPLTSGAPEFTLIRRKSGIGNNIIEGEQIRDISRRYKTVTVIGQQQGDDPWAAEDLNVSGTVTDESFPFYKPFVAEAQHDGLLPERYARVLMENQQFEGFSLTYTLPGHSQTGKNYQPNAVCHVIDEAFGIEGNHLIYSRAFELSRDTGPRTVLKLSKLGVLPA